MRNAGVMGKYNAAGLPDLSGSYVPTMYTGGGSSGERLGLRDEPTGVFSRGVSSDTVSSFVSGVYDNISGLHSALIFSANGYNRTYGASSTVMPASADVVMGLYLGRTA